MCNNVLSTTPSVCNGRGDCIRRDACVCVTGANGTYCDVYYCYGALSTAVNVCDQHGNCTAVDVCACSPGWGGTSCGIQRVSIIRSADKVADFFFWMF